MKAFTNWRTTVPGLVLIGVSLLQSFAGVHIPGFESLDPGSAITLGLGLIAARDAARDAVTG